MKTKTKNSARAFEVGDKVFLLKTLKQVGWDKEREAGTKAEVIAVNACGPFGTGTDYAIGFSDMTANWIANGHLLMKKIEA